MYRFSAHQNLGVFSLCIHIFSFTIFYKRSFGYWLQLTEPLCWYSSNANPESGISITSAARRGSLAAGPPVKTERVCVTVPLVMFLEPCQLSPESHSLICQQTFLNLSCRIVLFLFQNTLDDPAAGASCCWDLSKRNFFFFFFSWNRCFCSIPNIRGGFREGFLFLLLHVREPIFEETGSQFSSELFLCFYHPLGKALLFPHQLIQTLQLPCYLVTFHRAKWLVERPSWNLPI